MSSPNEPLGPIHRIQFADDTIQTDFAAFASDPATGANQSTGNTALSAIQAAAELSIQKPELITASVTRPADTTAYAAGDVLSDSTSAPAILTFTNIARANGGAGTIIYAYCINSGNETTKPLIDLIVFDTAPVAQEDNAPFDPSDAEARRAVATIQFTAWQSGLAGSGGNSFSTGFILGDSAVFKALGGSRDLYAIPVIRNVYTPLSSQRFDFRLGVSQN